MGLRERERYRAGRVYRVGVRIRVEELRTGVASIEARHWLRVA